MKNHSKEEQEQVKMSRDTGSQGRSTDNSQEGWLDTDAGPNLALLCPSLGQAPMGQPTAQPGGYELGVNYETNLHMKRREQFRKGKTSV